MKLPSLSHILEQSTRTYLRFPYVILDAIVGTLAALVLIDHEGPPRPTILFKILLATALGIPLLISSAFIAEKRKWKKSAATGAQFIAILLLIAYAFSVPSNLSVAPNIHILRFFLLAVALHFFVAFGPFALTGEINGFWQYNKSLLLRCITGALFTCVLFAGLGLALAALDHLFGINMPGKRYPELWILLNGIFMTWFFLAGIPEDFNALDSSTDYPKVIRVFAQYVLFPLVLVYFIILYAYLGKILIAWDWPRGWVSGLILGFSVTGILSFLLLHPIRDLAEHAWIKKASRWFYVAISPLVVMLFLAVWRRISEYGLTENRYLTVAIAVWLAVIAVYFVFSKTKSIKVIPATLCLFSFLVVIGPWNLFTLSESSQVSRLKGLLTVNSMLMDGRIQKGHPDISYKDKQQISSILAYLHDIHGYDQIQPWFTENLREDTIGVHSAYKDPSLVAKILGIEYVNVWMSSADNLPMFSAARDQPLDIRGYDRMWRSLFINSSSMTKDLARDDIACSCRNGMDTLTVVIKENGMNVDSLQFDIRGLLGTLLKEYSNVNAVNIPSERMSVSKESSKIKVKLYVTQIQGRKENAEMRPSFYQVEVLYAMKTQ